MEKKRIVVTGSNGLVGRRILDILSVRDDVEILAVSKSTDNFSGEQNYDFASVDLVNFSEVNYVLQNFLPNAIIHTAAITSVDYCEQNKAECWSVNVDSVKNLADQSWKIRSKLISLSTDFIFDGLSAPYKEEDIPNPVSYYGLSKMHGEECVINSEAEWSIVRTILVYGTNSHLKRDNFPLWVIKNLKLGKPIRVVCDQYRMPTWVDDLASGCIAVFDRNLSGIYNLCGSEMLSVYDFACKTAEIFELDAGLITPVSSIELNETGRRPVRTGFDLSRAIQDLDYCPVDVETGLLSLKEALNQTEQD